MQSVTYSRPVPEQWLCGKKSPLLYCWAWYCMVWNTTSGSWGSLPAVSLPNLLSMQPVHCGCRERNREGLDTAQVLFSSSQDISVLLTGLVTSSKHSIKWTGRKKSTSIPAKPSTGSWYVFHEIGILFSSHLVQCKPWKCWLAGFTIGTKTDAGRKCFFWIQVSLDK